MATEAEYCDWVLRTCMKPEVWAAWVQAIGSILAIAATAIVMWWQHWLQLDHQRKRALLDEIAEINSHLDVLAHASQQLSLVHTMLREPDNARRNLAYAFETAQFDLIEIVLDHQASRPARWAQVALAFLAARAAIKDANRVLRECHTDVVMLDVANFEQVVEGAEMRMSTALQRLDVCRARIVSDRNELLTYVDGAHKRASRSETATPRPG